MDEVAGSIPAVDLCFVWTGSESTALTRRKGVVSFSSPEQVVRAVFSFFWFGVPQHSIRPDGPRRGRSPWTCDIQDTTAVTAQYSTK